jgi:hypothetical protein
MLTGVELGGAERRDSSEQDKNNVAIHKIKCD